MAKAESDVVIVDGVRTPMGKRRGTLSQVHTADMPYQIVKNGLFKRVAGLEEHGSELEDVIVGCNSQIGGGALDIGRVVALALGLTTVPGLAINRQCASGQTSMWIASTGLWAGYGNMYLAGGVEQQSKYAIMSDAAEYTKKEIPKYKKDKEHPDLYRKAKGTLELYKMIPGMPHPQVLKNYPGFATQIIAADRIAKKWEIPRETLDLFGYISQMKASKAEKTGKFKNEIVPVHINKWKDPKTGEVKKNFDYDHDEVIRHGTTLEKMASLRTVPGCEFVTAGNSCPINDGASMTLLATRSYAESMGWKPRAKILGYGVVGSDPEYMLTGPAPSIAKALKHVNMTLKDMEIIEVNEAFASVVIAAGKILTDDYGMKVDFGTEGEAAEGGRLNRMGGAIALGHPTACSGSRLVITMLNEMEREKYTYGIASLCVGLGMGIACVIEREE
ncbi:MAG: thiolase family protein [Candidatus Helarchaeota archaeon]|nr:thiolase family protein [Candidatus Helarchaeota archaeon]